MTAHKVTSGLKKCVMTKVTAVVCPNCKDTIYSRAHYDCHNCTCGQTFVDGGFEYLRIGGQSEPKLVEIEVDATKQELYQDWNKSINRFGLIKA